MLRVAFNSLIKSRSRLLVQESRATYYRGFWPEPISQQDLAKFLEDINYFDEPKQFINIGLSADQINKSKKKVSKFDRASVKDENASGLEPEKKVDELLNLLAKDAEVPMLDYDDVRLEGSQLMSLAMSQGIYRDLFGHYVPNREYINFTQEQAERMNRLVPLYWITDQPFSRVNRHPKIPEPVKVFEPLVGISAKFVHKSPDQENDEFCAHTSYYGNIIPASEALEKPSIVLDGKLLLPDDSSQRVIGESDFDNWSPSEVRTVNFGGNADNFYSIALLNLDHVQENAANLHWMLTNIQPSSGKALVYDEACEYLPVHGIRGYGYSRYVFLVFQHDSKVNTETTKVDGFSPEVRNFDVNSFIDRHKEVNMKPIGLSWFQTAWDESSNNVFHDYLNLKAPVYEHVQPIAEKRPPEPYPGLLPFNIYLDHERNKKDINEQVLLERLKSVDPFDYKDQYVPPRVPPTIFEEPRETPSWMTTVLLKKKNKIGYWRGLRPASATLPLENNADLDYPLRPVASSKKIPPEFHNRYPGRGVKKSHKDMPTTRPLDEHQAVFVQDDHQVHLEQVMKVLKEFEEEKKQVKQK